MKHADLERVKMSIEGLPFSMLVSDPRLDDCPVTYVNDAFERATLYSREMAIGRNCRFLQGEKTDPENVRKIREGLASGEDFTVDILNYRADGSSFGNRLLISPLRSDANELVGFLGIQQVMSPVAIEGARSGSGTSHECHRRTKNRLAMLVSLVRLQASEAVSQESLRSLSRRIESLSLLYEELAERGIGNHDLETVPAGTYLGRAAAVLAALEAHEWIRVDIDCEEMTLPTETAARLGLILSELVTNALEHAFVGRRTGQVEVRLARLSGDGVRLSVADDGCGMPPGSRWPEAGDALPSEEGGDAGSGKVASGAAIVRTLVESLEGQISVISSSRGTRCTVDVGF